jgi:hypothetical protein
MIELIIELLKSNDFYGVSEIVDVAKGKHELTGSIKKIYKQEIRKAKWQKKERLN